MLVATAYWPLWIRLPAYVVGIIMFGVLGLYGVSLLMDSEVKYGGRRTNWIAGVLIGLPLILIPNWFAAWHEKRVVAAFAEGLVADTLYFGIAIGAAVAGYCVGNKVYEKTTQKWLGLVVGIILAIALGASAYKASLNIPGVGWRLERLFERGEA